MQPSDMPMDQDQDGEELNSELMTMAAQELMQALETKDKKGVLEAIRAIVLSMDKD